MSVDAVTVVRRAYHRFGKGIGSPAVLTYGDYPAYGVAAAAGEPLLYEGNDFSPIDVVGVAY